MAKGKHFSEPEFSVPLLDENAGWKKDNEFGVVTKTTALSFFARNHI